MHISYKTLLSLLARPVSIGEVSEVLTNCGLEVEGVTSYSSIKGGLEGLIVGEVISCVKHPDADRLSVTQVEVGLDAPLSIVCGAPNVAQGQKVIVATVNTTLYPLNGEPFVIKKAKIRGVPSEGMICAEDEIGLSNDHDGIMILPQDTPVGTPAADLLPVFNDQILEIGLTANRGDAASHIGVARDIAACLSIDMVLPSIQPLVAHTESPFQISVESTIDCPRYAGIVVDEIKNQASPQWLQSFLMSLGLTPKNAIVDCTNYTMLLLGQPLHAFDANKLKGNQIFVQKATANTMLKTLDGMERKLIGEELIIADASGPIALAGVLGGEQSAVDLHTSRIFLESAYFDPGIIRKTAKQHTINTDASFRFERATDPEMCLKAMHFAAALIVSICGGKVASVIYDNYPSPLEPKNIDLRESEVKRICGVSIPAEAIKNIVSRLGFDVLSHQNGVFKLRAPLSKSDVTREIDVIEEVLRVYGFNELHLDDVLKMTMPKPITPAGEALKLKRKVSLFLRSQGFHEMQSNPMTKEVYFATDDASAIRLLNPLSNEMSVMRQSMIPNALEVVAYNQKRKNNNVKVFEFGKTYELKDDKFVETPVLCITAAGSTHGETWEAKQKEVDVFFIKNILNGVAQLLGVPVVDADNGLLFLGTPSGKLIKQTDCKLPVVCAEIDWKKLAKKASKKGFKLQELPKYPTVKRDLSLVLPKSITFSQIEEIAFKAERKLLQHVQVFDTYEGKPLTEDQKSYSVAFYLYDNTKTMGESQIDGVMQKLITQFETQLNAVIRK